MREFLFGLGFALTFIGGIPFVLSSILGSIVVMNLPFIEISRYDQPERFYFWRGLSSLPAAWDALVS